MSDTIILEPVECKSAEEFIGALSPLGRYFGQFPANAPWLFRGVGKESFKLIPKALRADRPLSKITKHDCESYGSQVLAERDSLIDFFTLADRRGLSLPDDSQELRRQLEILWSERGDYFSEQGDREWWPRNEVLSLVALAQHYGLPTRLLDWTRRSYIAAYFAAEDSIRHGQSENLVVWSLYYPALGTLDVLGRDNEPFVVVTAPSASNANLRAQQGMFTLVTPITKGEKTVANIPLDEAVLNSAAKQNENAKAMRIQRFVLAAQEAEKLLWLLAKMDITASTIFPDYVGVVKELEQRRTWRQFEESVI